MRKVILGLAVSLDGFIEGPNGEYDWCLTDQDYGMTDFMKRIDSIFYGRKSYEMMLGAAEQEWANPFAKMKSYIFSNTLAKPYEGTELISGNIAEQVRALKNSPGKDIWLFGGASLTTTFINENLVDEMNLAVHPLLLGSGKLLFNNVEGRKHFRLSGSTAYTSGLVMLNYEAIRK
jgi:dihydrofolate reductase